MSREGEVRERARREMELGGTSGAWGWEGGLESLIRGESCSNRWMLESTAGLATRRYETGSHIRMAV
jgi:hypothetical protein